jgi:hypothetical protein
LLKRNAYVDQVNWKIFPNLSVLLIGPSGVGKDTAIDAAQKVITDVGGLKVVGGRTIECLYDALYGLGDPASCYLPAQELTSFLGSKDYQQGMVQELTDLLSTKDQKDISTKSAPNRFVRRPTITMHAGSTEEWFQNAMPEGSLEGGMWPRFLIVYEEYASKAIPLVKLLPKSQVQQARHAYDNFIENVKDVMHNFARKPREVHLLNEAAELYENWYRNRFTLFSKAVQPYANRSRDQVLRLAMLCAVSRKHDFVDGKDMIFGIDLMQYVAKTIDRVMKPATLEARIAKDIVGMLPCRFPVMIERLRKIHKHRDIMTAWQQLIASEQLAYNKETKEMTLVTGDIIEKPLTSNKV